jgi:hypothetical protein
MKIQGIYNTRIFMTFGTSTHALADGWLAAIPSGGIFQGDKNHLTLTEVSRAIVRYETGIWNGHMA